ncbi:type IV pilus modification protein PilV [Undibacterium sp. TS12]|uniref:type IV pilus modification protein PilV n=1 Tax=Undibacterium sp. TS12 TaxID=2908202 RepID=UPI001F4CF059|nr:type IV pilus modification protein PilV [Undibacterium sp. TS12]MCH8619687.1 type IV pilus modification protein PilV [Undibacterium sp. TS12]
MKIFVLGKQKGVSMVEIIVTMVIVAIGLLGVASLQANTLKYLKSANYRSEATQAAYDISDRMRANGQAIKDKDTGAAPNFYNYQTPYATTIASLPTVPGCANSNNCTPQEVANKDVAEWLRTLGTRMYGGAGYIVQNAVGGYDVTVMWKEPNFTAVDPACPAATPPAPGAGVRCISLRFTP